MAKETISGETPIRVQKDCLMVGPSNDSYTVCYAAEKEGPYTPYTEVTPSGENVIINGLVPYSYIVLSGNTDEVVIIR